MNQPIFLTGFMGAGKTTVGKLLAVELRVPFVDTDREVEAKVGLSLSAYVKRFGWPAFRRQEKIVLRQCLSGGDSVIATGGGVVLDPQNRYLMMQSGTVIWLKVPWGELLSRLQNQTGRPLVKSSSSDELKALYLSRLPYYRQAHFSVVGHSHESGTAPEYVVREILRNLAQ